MMAQNIWQGDGDTDGNDVLNWSRGALDSSDDLEFNGDDDTACILTDDWTCATITAVDGYQGAFDAAGFDVTTSGDQSIVGGGSWDFGSGTWLCSGNHDSYGNDSTDMTDCTFHMLTSGKTFNGPSNGTWGDLHFKAHTTIQGSGRVIATYMRVDALVTLTIAAGKIVRITGWSYHSGWVDVYGKIDIEASGNLVIRSRGHAKIKSGGEISGDGIFQVVQGYADGSLGITEMAGTFDVADVRIHRGTTIPGGVYGGSWLFEQNYGGHLNTVKFGVSSGETIEFSGPVAIELDAPSAATNYDYDFDFLTHNANLVFNDSVTITAPTAFNTLNWIEGSGKVTFKGTGTWSNSEASVMGSIGDVDVDGTSLTLASNLHADDFTLVAGALIPSLFTLETDNMTCAASTTLQALNGCTFTVLGDFQMETMDLSDSGGEWFLNVTGSNVANGTGTMKNCNASGSAVELDASVGPWTDDTSGAGNTNVNFGVSIAIKAMHHQMQMAL